MPWSKHYYTVAAEPPRRKTISGGGVANGDAGVGGGAKGDDDSLCLSLSLGDIYSNNAPATPVLPAGVLRSPSAAGAAAVDPPPLFDAQAVEDIGAFFPASGGSPPALPQMTSIGDGVVIPSPAVRADDVTASPAAPTKPPRPPKRPRSVSRRSISTAGNDDNVEIDDGLHPIPPYPWSTNRVGKHHTLAELSRLGINTITGELQCKRCDAVTIATLDAKARFEDLCVYIAANVQGMDDRAPKRWREPALPDCGKCGQRSSMRPVIPADKHKINWVFLLLGEMLGVCTLEQLKHFCAHTQQHRTGAKDRVLYSTYMELCNQLLPNGMFDMESERRKRTRLNV
ncbi:unnamed protein product [Urochloa humidicola]